MAKRMTVRGVSNQFEQRVLTLEPETIPAFVLAVSAFVETWTYNVPASPLPLPDSNESGAGKEHLEIGDQIEEPVDPTTEEVGVEESEETPPAEPAVEPEPLRPIWAEPIEEPDPTVECALSGLPAVADAPINVLRLLDRVRSALTKPQLEQLIKLFNELELAKTQQTKPNRGLDSTIEEVRKTLQGLGYTPTVVNQPTANLEWSQLVVDVEDATRGRGIQRMVDLLRVIQGLRQRVDIKSSDTESRLFELRDRLNNRINSLNDEQLVEALTGFNAAHAEGLAAAHGHLPVAQRLSLTTNHYETAKRLYSWMQQSYMIRAMERRQDVNESIIKGQLEELSNVVRQLEIHDREAHPITLRLGMPRQTG